MNATAWAVIGLLVVGLLVGAFIRWLDKETNN